MNHNEKEMEMDGRLTICGRVLPFDVYTGEVLFHDIKTHKPRYYQPEEIDELREAVELDIYQREQSDYERQEMRDEMRRTEFESEMREDAFGKAGE